MFRQIKSKLIAAFAVPLVVLVIVAGLETASSSAGQRATLFAVGGAMAIILGLGFVGLVSRSVTKPLVNLAKQVVRGCEKLAEAVHGMRSAKNYEQVMQDCITVHEVENAADDILHAALAELFTKEKNAIEVIKWKDIYETMEKITDRLEDVANVLQGVIVKMS